MRKYLKLVLSVSFLSVSGYSETLKKIQVLGNSRIEFETITNELPVKVGQECNDVLIAEIIKVLNKTGYFSEVSARLVDGVLVIEVTENPIINRIDYEGMSSNMKDVLKDLIKIKPRQVLSSAAVQETQQMILEAYRRQGSLNAHVTPKIVRLPNNRVDLVFEIKSGSPAYVRKIVFVGNTALKSGDLRNAMKLQEKKWFHIPFLGGSRNRVYDPDSFTEDQRTLIKIYLNHGYADFHIVSAVAELTPDKKDFFLTYYLHEGGLYKFGDISIDSKLPKLNIQALKAAVMAKKGMPFSEGLVEACQLILKSLLKGAGYAYATIEPVYTKNLKTKTVDISFVIKDGPKMVIEKVNIKGNRQTRDRILRRQLNFVEGDPFDYKIAQKNEESLKHLNFVKSAKISVEEGSTPQQAIVDVEIEEQKTGEISAKGGYSTIDGFLIEGKLADKNFLGKAQELEAGVSYSQKIVSASLQLAEPRLWGRDLYGSVTLFHTNDYRMAGWRRMRTGAGASLAYHLSPRVIQNIGYTLHRESTRESDRLFKKFKKKAKGKLQNLGVNEREKFGELKKAEIDLDSEIGSAWGSAVTHLIAYDRRNRTLLPTKGFRVSWKTTLSGLGGSIRYLRNTWSGSWHHGLWQDVTLTLRGTFSHACGIWGKPLRVSDSLFLGGDTFRGFDFNGISPRRGLPVERIHQLIDAFIDKAPSLSYLSDKGKQFLVSNKQFAKDMFVGTQLNKDSAKKAATFERILQVAKKQKQEEATEILKLGRSGHRRLGGSLSWTGSAEVTFPMPVLPRDAEVFGTVFMDFGSVWRSLNIIENSPSSVKDNDHFMRISAGFSVAWNSPFGVLSVGYAWPIRKRDSDNEQKFLFGYGLRFN